MSTAARPRTARSRSWTFLAYAALAAGLAACGDHAPTAATTGDLALLIVSGDGQSATVGTELPQPVVVKVVTSRGFPVPGKLLNFRVIEGGGSVFAGSGITNFEGIAQDYWTLGARPGLNVLEVRAIDPVTGAKQVFGHFEATGTPIPVASVVVSPASASVVERGTRQLTATLYDAAGNELTDGREVSWTSSNEAIATVSSTGLVTGVVAGGPVTITATREGRSASASITVTPAPVATVTVTPSSATIEVGESAQLAAVLRDAAGVELTGRSVTWTTANASIVQVSATGEVTGVAVGGPVTITATSEGKQGTAQVTVAPGANAVASITLSPSSATDGPGTSVTITATLRNASGVQVSGTHTVSWTSSNPLVASVPTTTTATNGTTQVVVSLLSDGFATITASVDGASRSASVTVLAPDGYEPNETVSAARFLGTINDDGLPFSITATIHSTIDVDWYRVRAREVSSSVCFPGSDQDFRFRVDLTQIPAGRDYDLEVRVGSPSGSSFTSAASGNANEQLSITVRGTCGSDDSFDFYIRVHRFSGVPSSSPYRLTMSFDKL